MISKRNRETAFIRDVIPQTVTRLRQMAPKRNRKRNPKNRLYLHAHAHMRHWLRSYVFLAYECVTSG